MSQAAGGAGLLVVVFSTLRVNDLNLYSLRWHRQRGGRHHRQKLKYTYTTLVIGILGTTLSVLGILDRFVDFLTVLGVVFPPIIGIMLVDYYRCAATAKSRREPPHGPVAKRNANHWLGGDRRQHRRWRRWSGDRMGRTDHQLWWPPACCIVLKLAFSRAQNRWPHRSRSDFRP